jgi:hypothetical protein
MSGVSFLLLGIGLSFVGSLIVWWRSRKPTSWDSGITEFSRNMHALGQTRPESTDSTGRRSRRR